MKKQSGRKTPVSREDAVGIFTETGVFFNRKLRSLLKKTLRGMRTRAKQKFVAKATALGARVPFAELFVLAKQERII